MEVIIDLHAAEVDQLGTARARLLEALQGLALAACEIGLALDVQCVRLQRPFTAGLRETDRIEDAGGNVVFGSCREDLFFTATDRRLSATDRRRQSRETG